MFKILLFFLIITCFGLAIADFTIINNLDFLSKTKASSVIVDENSNFVDSLRLYRLIPLVLIFVISSIYVAGKEGLRSLLALVFSLIYGFFVLIPALASSGNLFFISLLVFLLMLINLLITHGVKSSTFRAFIIMFVLSVVFLLISTFFTDFLFLTGVGNDESFFLAMSENVQFDMRILFNIGVILGTFGVLDDVVISQMSIVNRLYEANPKYTFAKLYNQAMVVGRHHIASLINTLFFAYMAAFLPWLLVLHVDVSMPVWFRLNTEMFIEEFIRIILGSTALILAVPLTTFIQCFKKTK